MLALTVVCCDAVAQKPVTAQYNFTTLTGDFSRGSLDGPVSVARFSHPSGIARDAQGTVFVADTQNHTIRKITGAGIVTVFAGQAGKNGSAEGDLATALFNLPAALAFDHQGNLYVVDSGNDTIRKISPTGNVTTLAGSPGVVGSTDGQGTAARFSSPANLAIDAADNIFVADYGNATIRKITPTGAVTTFAGTAGQRAATEGAGTAARFFGPTGIAVDSSGALYVADLQVVRKITASGTTTTLAGVYGQTGHEDGTGSAATFALNCGVAVDAGGNVYVVDRYNCTVRKITPAGEVTTVAGVAGALGGDDGAGTVARFDFPSDVWSDAAGNLLVTDTENNTIRGISTAGVVTTLAGLSPFDSAGDADGVGRAARFYQPEGLAFSPSGDLYVADRGNHTIRRVSTTGAVITIAGVAASPGFADGMATGAQFSSPVAVAVDPAGNVYVADNGNYVVRKITPAGIVSTLAGQPGLSGTADGPEKDSRFTSPNGIAVGTSGDLYVADGPTIRRIGLDGQVTSFPAPFFPDHAYFQDVVVDKTGNIFSSVPILGEIIKYTPSGVLSQTYSNPALIGRLASDRNGNLFGTDSLGNAIYRILGDGTIQVIAGKLNYATHIDGLSSIARFNGVAGIAIDAAGNIHVASSALDDNTIRKGQPGSLPVITTQPLSQTVSSGASAQFSVVASADPAPVYQWYFNGTLLTGATGSSYTLAGVQNANAGDYTVVVTNLFGNVTSGKATLTISSASMPPASSGGGGGGAMSEWFVAGLLILAGVRRAHHNLRF